MSEPNAVELYRKHRPTMLKQIWGQEEAVKILNGFLNTGVPHVLLFTGPSGVGKTTMARILKDKLGCSDIDFEEINAASDRGIDMVRTIENRKGLAPFGGSCRIWVLDEVHQASKRKGGDAQTALLKVLEDCPPHVYFFLCTTHPNELLPTIRTRCSVIDLKALTPKSMKGLLNYVAKKEKKNIGEEVGGQIVEVAEGSARRALQLLQSIWQLDTEEEQLEAIRKADTKKNAFDIVKALIWGRAKWPEVAQIIKTMEDTDWEGIRRLVLANATNELLKGGKLAAKAYLIIRAFESNWYDCGKAGFVASCYDVLTSG